jgi:DNA-binding sugar fermentation-stimulating protein
MTIADRGNEKMNIITDANSTIKGTFLVENKRRFLCEVEVSGKATLCYVPSSCRLDKLISLAGKEVLLLPTAMPNAKTEYSLYAVAHKGNYIVLNASIANRLVEQNIQSRRFSFLGKRTVVLREHIHEGYKCDLFIEDTQTVVEIKSIISADTSAPLFSVNSQRAMKQLSFIEKYMERGLPVCYIIVALNPFTKKIVLNPDNDLHSKLLFCVAHGMKLYCMSCNIDNGRLKIKKEIPITLK